MSLYTLMKEEVRVRPDEDSELAFLAHFETTRKEFLHVHRDQQYDLNKVVEWMSKYMKIHYGYKRKPAIHQ